MHKMLSKQQFELQAVNFQRVIKNKPNNELIDVDKFARELGYSSLREFMRLVSPHLRHTESALQEARAQERGDLVGVLHHQASRYHMDHLLYWEYDLYSPLTYGNLKQATCWWPTELSALNLTTEPQVATADNLEERLNEGNGFEFPF